MQAGDDAVVETVAGLFGDAAFLFHPTGAAAGDVGLLQILPGERLPLLVQFEDGFGQLRAGGPGLVDAGAGEDVGAAGAFADACVAIAARGRVRRGVPDSWSDLAPQERRRAALQMAPDVGVQEVVLEVAVGRSAWERGTRKGRRCRRWRPVPGARRGSRRSRARGSRRCGRPCRARAAQSAADPPPSSYRRPIRADDGRPAARTPHRAAAPRRRPAHRRPRSGPREYPFRACSRHRACRRDRRPDRRDGCRRRGRLR